MVFSLFFLRISYPRNPIFLFLAICAHKHAFEQVRGGQLWGTDIYTDDSYLVVSMCFNNINEASRCFYILSRHITWKHCLLDF